MSKKIVVGCGAFGKVIYAGNLIANGTRWGANRQDVTMDCLLAVIEYCLKDTGAVEICTADGEKEFEISVKDLRVKEQAELNTKYEG